MVEALDQKRVYLFVLRAHHCLHHPRGRDLPAPLSFTHSKSKIMALNMRAVKWRMFCFSRSRRARALRRALRRRSSRMRGVFAVGSFVTDAFEAWGTEHLRRCGWTKLPEHPMPRAGAVKAEAA